MSAKIWIVEAEHYGESGHRDAIYGAHPDELSAKQHAVLVDVSPVLGEESRGSAFVVSVDLLNACAFRLDVLKRIFDALWDTQWTTRHAGENTVCAYGCARETYKDQLGHYRSCKFVKLWTDLRSDRLAVGEHREPEVVS